MSREQQLLQRMQDLKQRAQRVADIHEVERVFNRYLQYYALQHRDGCCEQFALDQPDVSVEEAYSEGFEGADKVREYFEQFARLASKPGILMEQQAVCPVIEIAGDGATAKMVCFSRGVKCVAPAELQTYVAGRYYVDFVKTADGAWKIWHLHWFMVYETPVKVGFLHQQTTNGEEWRHPELRDVFTAKANRPSSYWPAIFNPGVPYEYIPEAPAPYESYDGVTKLKRTRILQHMWDRDKY